MCHIGHDLTWEKGRQLKSFDNNTYTYNASGIRTSKTVNGVTHTYTLDGPKILREDWGTNSLMPLYDNFDQVCGLVYNDTPYYFNKNLQGDIIEITDQNANIVARYTYDAWGKCTIVSDNSDVNIATINPFRYRSYYYDVETGLYYLQSRYYDPAVGRFINADVLNKTIIEVNKTYFNLFSYCNNDPVNNTDSSGCALGKTIALFVIGLFYGLILQFLTDFIIYYFDLVFSTKSIHLIKLKDYLSLEEYAATALTWALEFSNPFKNIKFLKICSGLIIVVLKHMAKLLSGNWNTDNFIIDMFFAFMSTLFSALDKQIVRKLNKIVDKIGKYSFPSGQQNIKISVELFDQVMAMTFSMEPAFLQKIASILKGAS